MKSRTNYYAPFMSRDYDRLKKLLDRDNVVVCFVDYLYDTGGRRIMFRDVAKVKNNDSPVYSKSYGYTVEARGIIYGQWDSRMNRTFEEECERMNLEFIDYGGAED